MKEHLRQILDAVEPNALMRRNVAREYLQARILQSLQDGGVFLNWAFLGGTALRFLYGLPRYSEDCDFSIIDPARPSGFVAAIETVRRDFEAEGYAIGVKAKDEKTVQSAFIRFPGLFYELHLTPRSNEALSVKIEIDTRPPQGAGIETTLVRRHVTLNLPHYDKASLLAGKLHALLTRRYTKGRDIFDLIWYLSDPAWPPPNLTLLNAALKQTGWEGPALSPDNWRPTLRSRLDAMDWSRAVEDVRPFLARPQDAALLAQDNCRRLLSTGGQTR